jgi:hypothetical protein
VENGFSLVSYTNVQYRRAGEDRQHAANESLNAEVDHDAAKIGADVALGQAGRDAAVGGAADGVALGSGGEVAAAVTVELEVCTLVE